MSLSKATLLAKTYEHEAWLARHLPASAIRWWAQVLNDDTGAAHLIWAVPNELRGIIVRWLYWRLRAGLCSVITYRDALDAAWEHDHSAVIQAALRNYRNLRAMFRLAQFPLPTGIPDQIEIWRGTKDVSIEIARRGISWSLRRDLACWFATSYLGNPTGEPLLLKAAVSVSDVYIPRNTRAEFEVVWFDGSFGDTRPTQDGKVSDWAVAARREEALNLEINDPIRRNDRAGYATIIRRISPYGAVFISEW